MDDQRNARNRREIVVAVLFAAEHPGEILGICADVEDTVSAPSKIADAFGFSTTQAEAILSMQVRRFTPYAIEQLRAELADIDAVLAR